MLLANDDYIKGMVKNNRNRRRTEMQAVVSTALAERFSQVTPWDAFGAWRFWTGF